MVNNEWSVRADSTLSACIRSLPLAVLYQLYFKVESTIFHLSFVIETTENDLPTLSV